MLNVIRAWLTSLVVRIILRMAGKETVMGILNRPIHELITKAPEPKPTAKMQHNPYLANLLAAAGISKQEAAIRSEIFAGDDLPHLPGKIYYIRPGYWIDV